MRFSIPIPLDVAPVRGASAHGAAAERAVNGMDEDGFRVFYEETAGKLRVYVRRAAGDAALADDIVQETFLRFLRANPRGLDQAQRKAYLYRTATALLVDHWRRVKRGRRWSLTAWFEDKTPEPSHLRLDVPHVFAQLNPQQQALLWLAYVEGFDHREIAAALQLRERSVRVLLYRARRKMARLLTAHGLGPQDVSNG